MRIIFETVLMLFTRNYRNQSMLDENTACQSWQFRGMFACWTFAADFFSCYCKRVQAKDLHINVVYLLLPAGMAASYAFMLPVATPPNAIAFSYGRLTVVDMVCYLRLYVHLFSNEFTYSGVPRIFFILTSFEINVKNFHGSLTTVVRAQNDTPKAAKITDTIFDRTLV